MMQDRDTDNPYQSPCGDESAHTSGLSFRRTRAADLAIVGGVRGSVIGATIGGSLAALLRSGTVLWMCLVESEEFGELAGVEAVLAEIVGFATFGAILGAVSGLLIGATLGIMAGRTDTRFRGRFLTFSVAASAASGLGWSAFLRLTTWDESQAGHPMLPILATFLVILAAAFGGLRVAIKVADVAWGPGGFGSLPKSKGTR